LADNRSVICALAVALIVPLALALAGCGRKGPLDPPPSAAMPPPPTQQYQPAPSTTGLIDPLTPTGQAQQAPPPVQTTQVAPAQPQRKGFLLDPLIQ
jgi:predicted small lipoprotein YifL